MGYLVQLMLVTKARSWHQVVLVQLVNGSSGLARVFNSSTIVDCARFQFLHNCGLCSPFSDCARHSPLIAGNPSTSGGEIETADCEIWSAAAFRLLYSQCTYCCLILFPIYILLFYSHFPILFPILQCVYCCLILSICPRGHDVRWYNCRCQRAPILHSFKGNGKSYKIKSQKYFYHC